MTLPISRRMLGLLVTIIAGAIASHSGIDEVALAAGIEGLLAPILGIAGAGAATGGGLFAKRKIDSARREVPPEAKVEIERARIEIPPHAVSRDELEKARAEVPPGYIPAPPVMHIQPPDLPSARAAELIDLEAKAFAKKDPIAQEPKRPAAKPPKFTPPAWTQAGGWFKTNLENDDDDDEDVKRFLPKDVNCLWVYMRDAKALTVQLYNESRTLLQIDQSSDTDEDNDSQTTRIELFDRTGRRFPPGVYKFRILGTVLRTSISDPGDKDEMIPFRLL